MEKDVLRILVQETGMQYLKKTYSNLEDYYAEKIKKFDFYEEQINELRVMLANSETEESNHTLNLMIENILLDKNREEIDLKANLTNEENQLLINHLNSGFGKSYHILTVNFIKRVIKLLDKKK